MTWACILQAAAPLRESLWSASSWLGAALLVVSGACAAGPEQAATPGPVKAPRSAAAGNDAQVAAEASAYEVLDRFMQAFSSGDIEATEATFLFPHVRLASGTVTVLERSGERPDLFARFRAANPEWARSAWLRREVISSSQSKVHFDTEFARYRSDGSEIARYRSIYVVEEALSAGESAPRWGIRARSSFAP